MAMVTSVQKLKLSPTLKTIPISLTINNVRLLVYNGRPGEGNPVKDRLRAVSLFLENRAYLFCVLPHGFLRRETARSLCKRLLLETEIWPTLPELTITVKSNVFCFVLFCFVLLFQYMIMKPYEIDCTVKLVNSRWSIQLTVSFCLFLLFCFCLPRSWKAPL